MRDESEDLRRVGRDEMNLCEFPIATLADRVPERCKTLGLGDDRLTDDVILMPAETRLLPGDSLSFFFAPLVPFRWSRFRWRLYLRTDVIDGLAGVHLHPSRPR